eukprot:130757-Rhodomonas_salina.1
MHRVEIQEHESPSAQQSREESREKISAIASALKSQGKAGYRHYPYRYYATRATARLIPQP